MEPQLLFLLVPLIKSLATHLQQSGLAGNSQGNLWKSGFFGAVVWVKQREKQQLRKTNPREHVALVISGWLSNYPSYGATGDAVQTSSLALGLAEHRTRKPKHGPNISLHFFLVDSQAGRKLNLKQLPNSNKQDTKKTAQDSLQFLIGTPRLLSYKA